MPNLLLISILIVTGVSAIALLSLTVYLREKQYHEGYGNGYRDALDRNCNVTIYDNMKVYSEKE